MILPAMTGILVLSGPITRLIFQRGAFSGEAVILTSSALFFYSIGHGAYALRDLTSRTFYALGDTRTPMKNSIFGMVLNIILNIVLSRYLGIGGLALATSIAAIVTASALSVSLGRRMPMAALRRKLRSIMKITVSSAVMGTIVWFTYILMNPVSSLFFATVNSVFIGLVSYIALTLILNLDEAEQIRKEIAIRIRRKD
jgi:putative peptidoglycan lipid II flippase